MAGNLDKIDLELRKKIAARFKEFREKSGKNQTEFAYDIGMDKQTWYRLEKGRGATIYTINKFCKSQGFTLSHFFDTTAFKELKK